MTRTREYIADTLDRLADAIDRAEQRNHETATAKLLGLVHGYRYTARRPWRVELARRSALARQFFIRTGAAKAALQGKTVLFRAELHEFDALMPSSHISECHLFGPSIPEEQSIWIDLDTAS